MFPNQKRGLRVAGSNYEYLTEGAYGVVFVDRTTNRILKIYRQNQKHDHAKEVFLAETKAYEIANSTNAIKHLSPLFYGARSGLRVIDRESTDVTNEFHSDLCFEAEYVPGRFEKIISASAEEGSRITEQFKAAGIIHMSDVSVRIEDGKIKKVIDFAVREIVPEWD
jgi:hypothetical protein